MNTMRNVVVLLVFGLILFSCEEKKEQKAVYDEHQPATSTKTDTSSGPATGINIGDIAPDIFLPNPQGKMISLSSLKGKYVLIDFWASWCAPCRQENPNVVRMYQTYKDKGFEIYGVSLDQDKDAWIDAIQRDGLTWAQVSDLNGWRAAPAQTFGVRAIPATVLLDKEGKIIARDLRGEELEQKLKEVIGS
jgi:peroxiredoxin